MFQDDWTCTTRRQHTETLRQHQVHHMEPDELCNEVAYQARLGEALGTEVTELPEGEQRRLRA